MSCQNDSTLSREQWLLLTSNRLAVSSSSSCSSWFLTCDRRSHSLSLSFSSWDVQEKKNVEATFYREQHLHRQLFFFTLSFVCPNAWELSRIQHLLCSVQLLPEDLWPLFSDFFFFDLQRRAAEPGECAMTSAWGRPGLASSLQSGLWIWIQIYQPSQHTSKNIINTNIHICPDCNIKYKTSPLTHQLNVVVKIYCWFKLDCITDSCVLLNKAERRTLWCD